MSLKEKIRKKISDKHNSQQNSKQSNEHKEDLQPPKDFHIIGYNDDVTQADFVVYVIENICHHTHEEAQQLMLEIHTKGQSCLFTGTFDIARTKANQITNSARMVGFPFKVELEEA
jgi:ATP-dependent Clp protease adaptor protein ClpS